VLAWGEILPMESRTRELVQTEMQEITQEIETSTSKMAPERDGVLTVLRRNPAGVFFMLFLGLNSVMAGVPSSLVVANMAAEHWGTHMAQNQAMFATVRLALGVLCMGPFGMLGDRYGNRSAVLILTCLMVLPNVGLLVLGEGKVGLISYSLANVLSGIGGCTMTGAPCMYALIHEVVAPADYGTFMGVTFAVVCLTSIVGTLVGGAIMRSGGSKAVLWFSIAVFGVLMGILALVRPSNQAAARDGDTTQESEVQSEAADSPSIAAGQSSIESMSDESAGSSESGKTSTQCALFSFLSFAFQTKALLRVCLIGALVGMSETILVDVLPQYAYSCLGLLSGEEHSRERTQVSLVMSITLQFSIAVGCLITGVLSRRFSTFGILKCVIVFGAAMQVVPVILYFVSTHLVVIVSSACLGLSVSVMPPLQAIVPQVAPEGRIGEAMGAMGSFKCGSYLVSSIVLSAGLPVLEESGLENPLWLLFPCCGLLALSAFPLALGLKPSAPQVV